MVKSLSLWIVVWTIAAVLVTAFGYAQILPGIGLAALISFAFVFKTLADQWSGTVTEVKSEEVYTPNDDGGFTNIVEFAYIKLTSGKTKRTQNLGWKVGDKLEKIRGQSCVKVVN